MEKTKRKMIGNNILAMYDFNPFIKRTVEKNVDIIVTLNEILTLECCGKDYDRKGITHPCMDGMLYI